MKKKPILSICIPTYNRAKHLKKTLDSIVLQKAFGEDVEIIISDNASTDETEQVARSFCEKYDNIMYYRNEQNVRDKNYPLVLSRANGLYRKLCNDTMCFVEDSLDYMINAIKSSCSNKPVLFWHQNIGEKKDIKTYDINQAISYISYWATSISCYGVWEDDFLYNEDGCEDLLWQVPNLYNNIVQKKSVNIYVKEFYKIQTVENKDMTYGLFQVFYKNFINYVDKQVSMGNFSQDVLEKIRKDLLLEFFCRIIVNKKTRTNTNKYSQKEEFEKLIYNEYSGERYFWMYRFKLGYGYFKQRIKLFLKR